MGRVIRELQWASLTTKFFLKLGPAAGFLELPRKVIGFCLRSTWKPRDEMTRVIPRLVGQAGLWIGVSVCTVATPSQPHWAVLPLQSRPTPVSASTCGNACFIICSAGITHFLDALGFCQIRTYLKFQCLTAFGWSNLWKTSFAAKQHIFQIQNIWLYFPPYFKFPIEWHPREQFKASV